MTTRVPLPGLDWSLPRHPLPAPAAHYLLVVRRLRPGDLVTLFDTRGLEAQARLEQDASGPFLEPLSPPVPGRAGVPFRLAWALPRGDKIDDVLRQLTELGVQSITPFRAERSVTRVEPGPRAERKLERWRRIAEEAARQSGRADCPKIGDPVTLEQALAECSDDGFRGVLHPEGGALLSEVTPHAPATLFVGPEGGFSPRELALFESVGVTRLRLSCPILRTETAAIVGAALLLHRLGAA